MLFIHIYNACLVLLAAVHEFTSLRHVHIHACDGVVCSPLHKCTFSKTYSDVLALPKNGSAFLNRAQLVYGRKKNFSFLTSTLPKMCNFNLPPSNSAHQSDITR